MNRDSLIFELYRKKKKRKRYRSYIGNTAGPLDDTERERREQTRMMDGFG